jgi:hypothetical protein
MNLNFWKYKYVRMIIALFMIRHKFCGMCVDLNPVIIEEGKTNKMHKLIVGLICAFCWFHLFITENSRSKNKTRNYSSAS